MNLTSYQIKVAKSILKEKDQLTSLKTLVGKRLRRWAIVIFAGLGSSFCWWQLGQEPLTYVMIGLVVGGVLADFGIIVRASKISLLMTRIIDYDKLSQIIEDRKA